jgi:organic hydroperoxide reductase OsmC/OhrA
MHPFPHHYEVHAQASPAGQVRLAAPELPALDSAPPKEFDGPGTAWSPEMLLTAAVADCLVLSFRAITAASKLGWVGLEVSSHGTLERIEGKMRFTRFDSRARLTVAAGTDVERARRLLEKAEASCLIANSLSAERHLVAEVVIG